MRIWLWALNNLQGSYPASVHFRALGNPLAEWKEKLQSSDLVLAYISYSIVGHSRNKKLPSYGKSAYVLRFRRRTKRQSSLSLLASFHICFFCLHIPKSCSSFSLSNFLQTWFNFFFFPNPLLCEIMMLRNTVTLKVRSCTSFQDTLPLYLSLKELLQWQGIGCGSVCIEK